MLWPLEDTAWTASARWFWIMIIVFTVVRLTLVTLGLPRTRIRLFQEPVPARSPAARMMDSRRADRGVNDRRTKYSAK